MSLFQVDSVRRGGVSSLVFAASDRKHRPKSHPLLRDEVGETCPIVRILPNAAPAPCEAFNCHGKQATTHVLYRYGEFAWRPVGGYRCATHSERQS